MLSLLFFAFLMFGAVASEEITKLSNVLVSDLYGRTITLNNTEGRCVLIGKVTLSSSSLRFIVILFHF